MAKFFAEEAAVGRITKKEIADKLGKEPSQITKWLSHPSNLELDTISDLLLAMDAEMDYAVVRFLDRHKPNYAHPLIHSPVIASTPEKAAVKVQFIKTSSLETTSNIKQAESGTSDNGIKFEARLENASV